MADKNKSNSRLSVKRVLIDKSQSRMLVATAIAAFMAAFALVGGKMMIDQIMYQNRVISAKKDAVKQLRTNAQAASSLVTSYKTFISTSKNVLGGNPQGTGPQDGDNAKLVLDALPSKYDFPALATSVEQITKSQGMSVDSISGSDDEVNQVGNESSPNPEPIAMPFQLTANGNYQQAQQLIATFDKSIRPFQIKKMQISGGQSNMSVQIEAQSFYQPAKNFNITKKVVK